MKTIQERLLSNIEIIPFSGCWIWMAALTNKGYGAIRADKRTRTTHRVSYEEFIGPITDGLHVLHRCDVRQCICPGHLFLGTIADNNADMKAKNRHNPGERHGMAKLTAEQVMEIRALCEAGASQRKTAASFHLCQQTVSDLHLRKRWAHLE